MPGRYYIKTFGCQMNEYDSTRMGDVLEAGSGLTPTNDPAEADVLLMNTCSVREKAEDKVYSLLGEWRALKKLKPHVLIGVGGCVASQEGEGITRRAPYVDLVFGPQTLHRLPDMIGEKARTGRAVVDVSFPEIEKFDHLPAPRAEGASAYVSIMEGCSKYCTFCVVPYTRGDEVSRGFDSVMDEVRSLASQGVGEIHLLGQNVNAYAGAMSDGTIVDMATLIHYVAAVDGVERIRFTTSHPVEFGDSLIEAYANVPQAREPSASCGAVGLGPDPGGHEARVHGSSNSRKNCAVCGPFAPTSRYPLTSSSGFRARRSATSKRHSSSCAKPISTSRSRSSTASVRVRPRRRCRTRSRSKRSSGGSRACRTSSTTRLAPSANRWSARTQRVLVSRPSKKDDRELAGRTENGRWVNFAGPGSLIGQFVDVVIVEARPQSLRGRLVNVIPARLERVAAPCSPTA